MTSPSPAGYLDSLSEPDAREALTRCCGSSAWVASMLSHRPFGDDENLFTLAHSLWQSATHEDVLEALSHHPELGADLDSLRARFASTATWSASEQSAVTTAPESTLIALRDGNLRYRQRFGFTFVACATGQSAERLLSLLLGRENNPRDVELAIAASEQAKITQLRLQKLLP